MAKSINGLSIFDLYLACSQQDRFKTEIERAGYLVVRVYGSPDATPSDKRQVDEYYKKTANMFKWTSE